MEAHVFISYARDGAAGDAWAARFEAWLGERGIPYFRDVTNIAPDASWPRALPKAIEEAVAVLCVLSGRVAERDWIQRELTRAIDRKKPVIAARVAAEAETPFVLQDLSPLDFVGEEAGAFRRLGELLGHAPISDRAREVEYLQGLLRQDKVLRVERLYTRLGARQRRYRSLAKVLPEAFMPVSFRLGRRGGEYAREEAAHEDFEDVLDAVRAGAPRARLRSAARTEGAVLARNPP